MVIVADRLSRFYRRGGEDVKALHDISLEIKSGEMVGILGPSGSGKSTLMNLMGLLDQPTEGTMTVDGRSLSDMGKDDMIKLRRKTIGFIFQQFLLVPTMTAMQNVMLPMVFAGNKKPGDTATGLLRKVGLEGRMDHLPREMSGGEMQRVAIARALANGPAIMLADEPTGNLDTKTGEEIFELFKDINREGRTVVIVTHNHELAERLPRTISLQDGRMIADVRKEQYN